jgi:hypothetical protein
VPRALSGGRVCLQVSLGGKSVNINLHKAGITPPIVTLGGKCSLKRENPTFYINFNGLRGIIADLARESVNLI